MTDPQVPHDHTTYVEGCFRCDLSRAEATRFNWGALGFDDGGLPVHLPMGVTQDGQGPEPDESAHHFECWCPDPQCPLTGVLMAAFRKGRGEQGPIVGGSLP